MNARKCLIESRSLPAVIKLGKSRHTLETVWTPTMDTGRKEMAGFHMCSGSVCIVAGEGSHESWKMWKLSNLGCTALILFFCCCFLSWSSFCQRILFWQILHFSRQLNCVTQGLMTDRNLLMLRKHKYAWSKKEHTSLQEADHLPWSKIFPLNLRVVRLKHRSWVFY